MRTRLAAPPAARPRAAPPARCRAGGADLTCTMNFSSDPPTGAARGRVTRRSHSGHACITCLFTCDSVAKLFRIGPSRSSRADAHRRARSLEICEGRPE
ncbi:hypothetical protein EVAR_74569_1 [Eumeta japonica]|uniref:Uncharacterized protein n=1 Tax=Eumeta variegata TaxID=151549 RepID=A0A4C1TBV8_EUMVA|nr:hypothetical protein EVAR_74569_1 [Eumeta japonica]